MEGSSVDIPAPETVSLRAVTGLRSRRFSLPALPTQHIYLELDPHDATLVREPSKVLADKPKSGVQKMADMAAQWKANAQELLSRPQESFAHAEAMRIQAASQVQLPAIAPLRTSRRSVQERPRAGMRSVKRPVSRISEVESRLSRPSTPTVARGVTFALPVKVEEPRVAPVKSKPAPAPIRLNGVRSHDVLNAHAVVPARKPVPLVAETRSPSPRPAAEAPVSTTKAPAPTMAESQDPVKEAAAHKIVAGEEDRTDSVMLPSAAAGETAQEDPAEDEIAAAYRGYQAFIEDDEEMDRGRRRRRGNRGGSSSPER